MVKLTNRDIDMGMQESNIQVDTNEPWIWLVDK